MISGVKEPGIESTYGVDESKKSGRQIPVWEGTDQIISQEVRIIGPNGEKVDVMTFRGAFERDIKDFAEVHPELKTAVDMEDDDAIEIIMQEHFYHQPEMFYAPDKLIISMASQCRLQHLSTMHSENALSRQKRGLLLTPLTPLCKVQFTL